eukprot:scaffold13739_cov58-Phaeocystis_antarctica.AAC.1
MRRRYAAHLAHFSLNLQRTPRRVPRRTSLALSLVGVRVGGLWQPGAVLRFAAAEWKHGRPPAREARARK